MSLKSFHIVFITICTLLFGFMVFWGTLMPEDAKAAARSMIVAGIGGLVVLPVYGVYFLKKAKRIEL